MNDWLRVTAIGGDDYECRLTSSPAWMRGIPESHGSGFCSTRQNKKGGDANARPWFRFCRPCRR